jgi:hypothetical protein
MHAPQWLLSLETSTHVPPHIIAPAVHEVAHAPPLQNAPAAQLVPHAPQLRGSALVSTQRPAQSTLPITH